MTALTLVQARAMLIGDRLDLRALETAERLASAPLTIAVGARGRAVLFRYGAVVLFDIDPMEEAAFLAQLHPFVNEPLAQPEMETLTLRLDPQAAEGMDKDILV
ncbi:MAG TPA: RMD1 family protein, partial [Chromatiales bacterium]|nr:RMD1 family protein [Chromatiales bacterium]